MRGKTTDGPVSRYINRRISTRITAFIVKHSIPITPNQVSVGVFLAGLLTGLLYLFNPVLAGIAVQIVSIVDGVDGELARARGTASPRGGFLDAMLDRVVDTAIIIGASICASRLNPELISMIAGLLALSGSITVSYLHARGEANLGLHPVFVGKVPCFASRDVRLFIIFIGTSLGFCLYTLIAIAILTYAYVVVKTIEVFFADVWG